MADEDEKKQLQATITDLLSSKGPPDGPLKESELKRVLTCVNILVDQRLEDAELLESCTVSDLRGLEIPLGVARTLKKAFPGGAGAGALAGPSSSAGQEPFTPGDWRLFWCTDILETHHEALKHLPEALNIKNIQHPSKLVRYSVARLQTEFGITEDLAIKVLQRCRKYASTTSLREVLEETQLEQPVVSLRERSNSQHDVEVNFHPRFVKPWHDCEQVLQGVLADAPDTHRIFPTEIMSSDKGTSGEHTIQMHFEQAIQVPINRLLRFMQREVKHVFQLQAQKSNTMPDSQKKAIVQRCRVGQLPFDHLTDQAAEVADSAARLDTKLEPLSGILDLALAMVDGPDRKEISLGELKRLERLIWTIEKREPHHGCEFLEGKVYDMLEKGGGVAMTVDAPCLHWIWNHPSAMQQSKQAKLHMQVKGLLSQVTRYCGPRGIKYAFASNLVYTWFFMCVDGGVYVSKAYLFKEKILAHIFANCMLSLKHAEQPLEVRRWEPTSIYQPAASQGHSYNLRSSSSGSHGRGGSAGVQQGSSGLNGQPNSSSDVQQGSSHQHHCSGMDQQVGFGWDSRGIGNNTCNKLRRGPQDSTCKVMSTGRAVAVSPQHGKSLMNVDTAADTAQAPHLDQLRTVQQLLLSGDIGQQRTLRDLAAVAAGIQRNKVLGIIGVGLSGQVFSYRLPCGTLVALKFAPAGSEREAALRKEAAVLLKLQDQWDVTTPQLAAAGYDSTGTAFVLGTRYLQWARYMPSDQRLRPQLERALAAAHAVGIAHNDLRDSNVLVQMDHAGQDRLWLIDWGNAVVNASLEQLNKDQLCMESLLSGRE